MYDRLFDQRNNILHFLKVVWLHVGRQMLVSVHNHMVSKIPRFSVSSDNQKTWRLNIKNVEKADRGYYMCQVNTNPMISQVGHLEVFGKFYIKISMHSDLFVSVSKFWEIRKL